jgi:hypothetical protein
MKPVTSFSIVALVALAAVDARAQSRACFPSCRAGYVCSDGACVSLCNPPCGAGEQCGSTGECLRPTTPAAVTPAPVPVAAAPAPVTRTSAPVTPTSASVAAPPSVVSAPAPATADRPATAETSASSSSAVHTHDGFYFSASVGPGVVASGSATSPGSPDVTMSGAAVAFALAAGGTLTNGPSLGGAIFGARIPSPSYAANSVSVSGGSALFSAIGPFVDWYFDPHGGLHGQVGAGFAAIAAEKGSPQKVNGTTLTYPGADQSGTGAALLMGLGYDWWISDQSSLGALAHVQYVSGSVKADGDTTSTDVKALMTSIEISVTYN